MTAWQDSWTFRIVDQDTGAAVPGVPVSVLESGGRAGGYWVSDSDGLVRIPKHDQPRLRLRVGLRNEEAIEFDARSLPDTPIPLPAPRDLAVADGRWRKSPDARERPLQIVAKMVGARQIGDGLDAMPLDVCVAADLPSAAADTVKLLAERTERTCEALRRRALGVTEFDGEKTAGASLRTLRNMRSEGVLTYHFVEPIERHRVIVRTPRFRPALLVPFRLPNIATREVVRRFGHTLRRNLLDRTLAADVDLVRGPDAVPAAVEQRVYAHIAAYLPYYSATIIAAGDPAERLFALAKLGAPR